MKNIDKALEILQKTNDGDDLAPEHLYLLELAVNGFLSEKGQEVFDGLYSTVQEGYKKPWFHGIENLTQDLEGYIYWKGFYVEHYTLSWSQSEEARQSALELAERCKYLESIGVQPSVNSAIWDWEKYEEMRGQ